jgi:hypothetical protein
VSDQHSHSGVAGIIIFILAVACLNMCTRIEKLEKEHPNTEAQQPQK